MQLLGLVISRPALYMAIVSLVVISAAAYGFRTTSLFACQPTNNDASDYVAYCESTGYADYDYGAFWFDLEPSAVRAVDQADVLFLGNSRLQFALSSHFASDWFTTAGATYYLLGFAYDGNYLFAEPLLSRISPDASVYVVNLDLFFEPQPTPPARTVMYSPAAEDRYRQKRQAQRVHSFVCSSVPAICGQAAAIYRSRLTGAWRVGGGPFTGAPVTYDTKSNERVVEAYVTAARRFLQDLPVAPECQVLTIVPTVATPIATAREIADSLGRQLVAPDVGGLETYDGSHLDTRSANAWSQAFLQDASGQIRQCIDARSADSGGTR